MRTEKEIRQELKDLFEEDNALFNKTIEELDSYNGYLGDDRYYFMEEIDELLSDYNATDILLSAFCGYNQDDYIIDGYGEKHYGSFNPNCDYFKFNGYGNLVSAWDKNYSDYLDYDYLDDYFIDNLLENRSYLNIDADVEALLDELENAEQGEED